MKRFRLKSLLALVVVLAMAATAWAFYSTAGGGTASATVGSMTAPVVTVPATSTGSHTVSWTAATLSGNPPEASEITYAVERKLETDSGFSPITSGGCGASFNAATLSCTDTVAASGDYVYRVVAEFRSWTATSAAAGPVEVTVGSSDTTAPSVEAIVRAGTSPTNASAVDFTVTFSENVTGVDSTDFEVAATGSVSGASVASVTGSDDEYTVTVNTGTGDGTLGLDLDDDDTIVDGASNELGGTGADNGDFTGETYVVDKTAPTVQSINRVGGTPTNASNVQWTVTFSESVSGVGTADFALAASGVTGASITGVTGSGSSYTVTASTGSGTGSLGLNLVDDDSIQDDATNRLGGTGAVNGDFTGEAYTVDRTAPTVVGITRDNANPTNASSVSWTVEISESVTGLTQSDFLLSQASGVSGASITGFSGSGDTYTITANTGSGSGILSVALMDDDSVVDAVGNPLYGPGTTNFAGQVYTIDKTAPTVSSISRGTPAAAKTKAESVTWDVTFSESVTGVDSGDFALANTGLGGGPVITTVTGSGSTYEVTASTGTGDGTLGLNLIDNDSIADAVTNKLGGTGAGNGNFTGQTYTIDKTRPSVVNPTTTGIRSFDADNSAGNGDFEAGDYLKITFNEDMSGVAASDVDISISRTNQEPVVKLSIQGITQGSSTGSTGYLTSPGNRTASSTDGTITLESSGGGLSNNIVVIKIGGADAGQARPSTGTLDLVFDGGITDPAGNIPNGASTGSTFPLF